MLVNNGSTKVKKKFVIFASTIINKSRRRSQPSQGLLRGLDAVGVRRIARPAAVTAAQTLERGLGGGDRSNVVVVVVFSAAARVRLVILGLVLPILLLVTADGGLTARSASHDAWLRLSTLSASTAVQDMNACQGTMRWLGRNMSSSPA